MRFDFITCGSVDDGKSTLIGRLLIDSKAVMQDQLSGVQRSGQTDLALLTDGLVAEREQGITIDVAWRYFATPSRKFVIGDAPGHEQYTRNMVTAASQADAAVVLIDATKIDWKRALPPLLSQTRRHSLLVRLLRVPSIVFAVNKLDAVEDGLLAFRNISAALAAFAREGQLAVTATLPISALQGHNVVDSAPGWCGYQGPSLLQILEGLPTAAAAQDSVFALPVQWVEKFSSSTESAHSRRIFWGRVAQGVARVGQSVRIWPGGQRAQIAQVLNASRQPVTVEAQWSAGLVLDRELDVSRGDWLLQAPAATDQEAEAVDGLWLGRKAMATLAWMDDEPLVTGRNYWALHGHRWVKAKVSRIQHQIDVHTLRPTQASSLQANAIGQVELVFQEVLPLQPFVQSSRLGGLVLVDSASHRTAGAVLIESPVAF